MADPLVTCLTESLGLADGCARRDEGEPFVDGVSSDVLLDRYRGVLRSLIERHHAERVLDIGAGRNPQLTRDETERLGIRCTLLDISPVELAHAPPGFERIVGDIGAPDFSIDGEFDFVFSSMLAEHVPDGAQFHRNALAALRPGGVAFHFFPTLYSLPFVANRLLPDALTDALLHRFKPKRKHKFPAYYSWTRGPTTRQVARVERVGLEIVAYVGGFGHRYYRRVPPLERCAEPAWRFAERRQLHTMTSYAYLLVRRPERIGVGC